MGLWKDWKLRRTLKRLASLNPDERLDAVCELRRAPDRIAVLPLIRALSDSNEVTRSVAAQTLGLIGDSRATEPLVRVLGDKRDVRRSAIVALGKMRDPRAIQPLVEILRKQPQLRELVAGSLTNLGWRPETPELRALYAVAKHQFREAAIEGNVSVRPLIESYALNGAAKICEALRDLGAGVSNQVLDLALDREFWARIAAVRILGIVGDSGVVRPLCEMLQPSRFTSDLQRAVIGALEQLHHPEGIPYLLEFAVTGEVFLALDAIKAMASVGEMSAEALWKIVQSPQLNPNLPIAAIDALGDIRSNASLERLIGLLSPPDESYAIYAAKALGKIGATEAVQPLIAALTSGGMFGGKFDEEAVRALGELKDPRALVPLAEYAKCCKLVPQARAAITSISRILESCATSVGEEDLRSMAQMADIVWVETEWSDNSGQWSPAWYSVDCSSVRGLAERELSRREQERRN